MAVSGRSSVCEDRRWDVLSAAAMLFVSSIMVLTVDDYGFTYDEQYHYTYGENVLNWFLTLGADESALGHNHSYGVGYDLTHALLVRLLPFSPIDTAHYLCVAVALLGLLGTWNLARWLGGSLAGFLGLAFLVSSSVYYGQQFNNPKDVPFAAGYIWGLYYAVRVASEPSTAPKRFWNLSIRPSVSTNCFWPVNNGCESDVMPMVITWCSTPSITSVLSEVRVERVMKRVPVLMSTNTTGLYFGWRSFFMAVSGKRATFTTRRARKNGRKPDPVKPAPGEPGNSAGKKIEIKSLQTSTYHFAFQNAFFGWLLQWGGGNVHALWQPPLNVPGSRVVCPTTSPTSL